MADTAVVISFGNALLPKYSNLTEKINPIIAKNRTVSGKLFVDYRAKTRLWTISWDWLTLAQYQAIRAEYDRQFTTGGMLAFSISGPNVTVANGLAFMDMPSERKIKFAGQWVQGLSITIEEQNAIS
jgi:hypothetical protein